MDFIDMVTYTQLLEMDTSKLVSAAEASGGLARSLSHRGEEVTSAADFPQEMWTGLDSMSASFQLSIQAGPLFRASDVFNRGQAVLDRLAEDITGAKEHLRGARELVAGTGITISPDGTVTTPVVDSPTIADHNAALARQAAQIIREALDMAETADEAAVGALEGEAVYSGGESEGRGPSDFFKDRFDPGLSMDKDGDVSLSLGEGEHHLGIEGPSFDTGLGPFSLNSGGVGVTDNPYPGLSLDRWPPKVSAPFVDVSVPNVSVDLGEVEESADDFFTDLSHGLRLTP